MKITIAFLVLALFFLFSCSSFDVPSKVPVMDTYNALELALGQVQDWAREHRGETQTILDMGAALNQHDYQSALDDAKKLMMESATAGDAPPNEIIALVTLADETLKTLNK